MKQSRRKHSPSFKAKVHLEGARGIFGSDNADQKKNDEALVARLYQQIGPLKVEKDFLEGNLGR